MRRTRLVFFIIIAITASVIVASRLVMPVRPENPQHTPTAVALVEPSLLARGWAKLPDVQLASGSRLSAEVRDVIPVSTSIGSLYCVGEIVNNGDQALAKPEVIVSLRDASGENLRFETGYTVHDLVPPQAIVPVVVLFTDPPRDWQSFEVYIQAEAATGREFMSYLDLALVDVEMGQDEFGYYLLRGTVENTGDRSADFVQAVAALYGNRKKIVGAGNAYVDKNRLEPGESSDFLVRVMNVAAPPESFRVQFVGHAK